MNIDFDYKILGEIGTNCYLLYNKDNKRAVLIDPADEADKIMEMIAVKNCTLTAILLTHGHYDHIGAAVKVSKATKAPIYAGECEKEVLENPSINLSAMMGEHAISLIADKWLTDGEVIELAGITIRCIHTGSYKRRNELLCRRCKHTVFWRYFICSIRWQNRFSYRKYE